MRDKKDEVLSVYEDTLKMISEKYSSYPNIVMLCNDVLEVGKKMQKKEEPVQEKNKVKSEVKIVELGEKDIKRWERGIVVEYEGKEYSGDLAYSEEDGIVMYIYDDSEERRIDVENALWELISEEDYDIVCTDDTIVKK